MFKYLVSLKTSSNVFQQHYGKINDSYWSQQCSQFSSKSIFVECNISSLNSYYIFSLPVIIAKINAGWSDLFFKYWKVIYIYKRWLNLLSPRSHFWRSFTNGIFSTCLFRSERKHSVRSCLFRGQEIIRELKALNSKKNDWPFSACSLFHTS